MAASVSIDLDHAATTPPHPAVIAAMEDAWRVANPSSTHRRGRLARMMLDEARAQVAKALAVDPNEIVFCSGATEANNLALFGVLGTPSRDKADLLVSAIEHPSIREPARELARRGYKIRTIGVDRLGTLDLDALRESLTDRPTLASCMLVNNEIGTIQPIQTAARLAHQQGTLFHSDAVQATTACDISPRELGVDLMTLSGHKLGGPRGVGVLYVRRGIKLRPLLFGGGQESGLRPGTEHVAAAVGFAVALQIALRERVDERSRLLALRSQFIATIREGIPHAVVLGGDHIAPHIVAVAFPGVGAEALKTRLDAAGVFASSGSACAGDRVEVSHVVEAIDVPGSMRRNVMRFSLGRETTETETTTAAAIVVGSWRAMARSIAAPGVSR